jgi:magnesium-transporting ATPase (P-type)
MTNAPTAPPTARPADWTTARSDAGPQALELEQVYAAYGTGPSGLGPAEAGERLRRFGPNRLAEVRGPGVARRLLDQFVHVFALLLWAAGLLALLDGQPQLALAIVAVIVINGMFGSWQEYRAERAVAALKRLLPPAGRALRAGEDVDLPAEALVPGDVLLLAEGDRIAADVRLVQTDDLRVDESSLTGEAHPVLKSARLERAGCLARQAANLAFAGSDVVAGRGRAVVTATGMATEFGRIAHLTQAVRPGLSPLQQEVARLARRVALLSVAMGVGFFALGHWLGGLSLATGAVFAIGIVLGNVPEGLLPTMTLALALGVQRMARRRALVKRLSSVETLGSCTVICTDKTGTITENQMTVRELWIPGGRIEVTGAGYEPKGALARGGRPLTAEETAAVRPLLRIGALCNDARLRPPARPDAAWAIAGDPTEGALVVAAAKAGLDREAELAAHPLVRRLAFDPRRKRMSTVHRDLALDGHLVAFVKGAPRELLDHCAALLAGAGTRPLTARDRSEILAELDRMAGGGLRVLGMAYRRLPPPLEADLPGLDHDLVEAELVFVGLAGMHDPPRPEVAGAVATCRAAGLRVFMITGDYGPTAAAIARAVGIVPDAPDAPDAPEGTRIVTSEELDRMGDAEAQLVLAGSQAIFARATPEQKLRIVSLLQAHGEVVAVTGDGVNDAPALKKADIGVAMGVAGTDVAREAADVILLDDNFATIVAAIEHGRAIFDNMRKFVVYIFAHLAPEAIPFVVFALFGTPVPLTVMQILAIDLGTETLPALALGVEPAEPDVMRRPPRRRGDHLLDLAALLRGYAFLGGLSTVAVLGAFFLFLAGHGWTWGQPDPPTPLVGAQATTVVFVGIVVMQVANAFACRTERASVLGVGLLSNRFLLAGIAFELVLTAALVYVPWLQPLFGTAPIGWPWWAGPVAVAPLILLAEELRKAVVRRRRAGRAALPSTDPTDASSGGARGRAGASHA